jgi:hypothetical protein
MFRPKLIIIFTFGIIFLSGCSLFPANPSPNNIGIDANQINQGKETPGSTEAQSEKYFNVEEIDHYQNFSDCQKISAPFQNETCVLIMINKKLEQNTLTNEACGQIPGDLQQRCLDTIIAQELQQIDDPQSCQKLKDQFLQESCVDNYYHQQAETAHNPLLCQEIKNLSQKEACLMELLADIQDKNILEPFCKKMETYLAQKFCQDKLN